MIIKKPRLVKKYWLFIRWRKIPLKPLRTFRRMPIRTGHVLPCELDMAALNTMTKAKIKKARKTYYYKKKIVNHIGQYDVKNRIGRETAKKLPLGLSLWNALTCGVIRSRK